jgi:hypothetical protein
MFHKVGRILWGVECKRGALLVLTCFLWHYLPFTSPSRTVLTVGYEIVLNIKSTLWDLGCEESCSDLGSISWVFTLYA